MEAGNTIEGTLELGEAPTDESLPQMNVDTYASQLFWLVITFVLLMVLLNRIALPNIRGAIEGRRDKIQGDLSSAETLQRKAAETLKDYEASLAGARSRALTLAEENRKRVVDEVENEKAVAEAKSQAAIAEAESHIAAARKSAAAHVRDTAQVAAAEIVERLIGERVSEAEAAKAVQVEG